MCHFHHRLNHGFDASGRVESLHLRLKDRSGREDLRPGEGPFELWVHRRTKGCRRRGIAATPFLLLCCFLCCYGGMLRCVSGQYENGGGQLAITPIEKIRCEGMKKRKRRRKTNCLRVVVLCSLLRKKKKRVFNVRSGPDDEPQQKKKNGKK